MLQINMPNGDQKSIKIGFFKALDGWDIQMEFVAFAATTDRTLKRAFTLEVLSYAKVMIGDMEIPLLTDALIDNHLQSWENVQKVFEEVLMQNGIDPKTHADKPIYWSNAGAEMAMAFIAEATTLIGPAMETFGRVINQADQG